MRSAAAYRSEYGPATSNRGPCGKSNQAASFPDALATWVAMKSISGGDKAS
jgi:hypothetical protein